MNPRNEILVPSEDFSNSYMALFVSGKTARRFFNAGIR
jgi:hypothetical protein